MNPSSRGGRWVRVLTANSGSRDFGESRRTPACWPRLWPLRSRPLSSFPPPSFWRPGGWSPGDLGDAPRLLPSTGRGQGGREGSQGPAGQCQTRRRSWRRSTSRSMRSLESQFLQRPGSEGTAEKPLQLFRRGERYDLAADTLWQSAEAFLEKAEEHLAHPLDPSFLPSFLQAYLQPFLPGAVEPLAQGLFKHGHLLQIRRLWNCSSWSQPMQQPEEPFGESMAEPLFPPSWEQGGEAGGKPGEVLGRTGLKLEEARRQIAGQRELGRAQAVLVDQEVLELRHQMLGPRGNGTEQARQVERRLPGPAAVVEDERQHEGEARSDGGRLGADQLLPEEGDVPLEAHGHERVGGRLKLQEQVDVEPARFWTAPAQAPDRVAVALAQVVADETAANFLQSAELQVGDPALPDEAAQERLDHL